MLPGLVVEAWTGALAGLGARTPARLMVFLTKRFDTHLFDGFGFSSSMLTFKSGALLRSFKGVLDRREIVSPHLLGCGRRGPGWTFLEDRCSSVWEEGRRQKLMFCVQARRDAAQEIFFELWSEQPTNI